ncbi:hypothetical protein BDU57DRAFT_113418 [Ampelomyces quisqualis]|uniref:Uncharacterized protein n=1 Tax=Ampelomyces quisqualis TaxID=50730 RepID=A0A6A5Q6T7_AMPQU|nr:hypothetical protein BDU57DRAFT_113418 [Ampelomyces quisqualis]
MSPMLHAGLCCSVFLWTERDRAQSTHRTELSSALQSIWPTSFQQLVVVPNTSSAFAHGGCHAGPRRRLERCSHQRPAVLNARASTAYSHHTECRGPLAVPGSPTWFTKGGPTHAWTRTVWAVTESWHAYSVVSYMTARPENGAGRHDVVSKASRCRWGAIAVESSVPSAVVGRISPGIMAAHGSMRWLGTRVSLLALFASRENPTTLHHHPLGHFSHHAGSVVHSLESDSVALLVRPCAVAVPAHVKQPLCASIVAFFRV